MNNSELNAAISVLPSNYNFGLFFLPFPFSFVTYYQKFINLSGACEKRTQLWSLCSFRKASSSTRVSFLIFLKGRGLWVSSSCLSCLLTPGLPKSRHSSWGMLLMAHVVLMIILPKPSVLILWSVLLCIVSVRVSAFVFRQIHYGHSCLGSHARSL